MAGILTRTGVVAILAGLAGALAAPAAATLPGEHVFQSKCTICHATVAGGKKIGPSLFGVVGRTSGTLPGFAYSPAMKAAAKVWTPAELRLYIASPRTAVPGNRMMYAGTTTPQELDDLVAYLQSLK